MPEKTCSTCQCNKVCDHNKYGFENCGNYIYDDVVPKSEVERLKKERDEYKEHVDSDIIYVHRIKAEIAREIFAEIEKALDKNKFKGVSCFLNAIAELKKKYTEDKNDTRTTD